MRSIIICFSLHTLLFLTVESRVQVSCLTVSGEKKKCGGGFLKISYMNDETPVSPWQSPKPKYAKPISAFCYVRHFFSLSLSQIIELEEGEPKLFTKTIQPKKKKKLFTKTNKNQYMKTNFLARQKAYKNIHKKKKHIKKKLIKLWFAGLPLFENAGSVGIC